jgi:hypothetical protein
VQWLLWQQTEPPQLWLRVQKIEQSSPVQATELGQLP